MMVDYSTWRIGDRSVARLKLDPQNPRIPSAGRSLCQRDLIAELVEHDRVYELARDIAIQGFYPTEMLVAVEEEGNHYVVEGNRRLAALKLLITPDAAPEKHVRKFRVLSQSVNAPQISKVRTLVAPSRHAATPLIIDRHTHRQVERWSPAMQANFYKSLLDRGMTVRDLRDLYHLKPSKVRDFLRLNMIYRMACSLDLPDDVRQKVQNPHSFPVTNLERALESQQVRDFLGIKIDEQEVFVGKVARAEFRKGFSKIVTDVAKKEVDSRRLRNRKTISDYLKTFGKAKPDLRRKGRFAAGDLLAEPKKKPVAEKAKPIARRPRTSRSVIPSNMKCRLISPRINDVFTELRRLELARFPNASAMMLRTLLELCICNHIERSGHTEDLRRHAYRKDYDKVPKTRHPSLKRQLIFLIEKMGDVLPLTGPQLRAIGKMTRGRDTPMTIDSLDGFVHNPHVAPAEKELRAIMITVAPLLEIVLAEPTPDGAD